MLPDGLKTKWTIRNRLGPLSWGLLIVFGIQRANDIANFICKIFLGRVLPPLDFGALEPLLATITLLSVPATIIYSTAVKSISRLSSQGQHAQCHALIQDLQWVAMAGSLLSFAIVLLSRHFILSRLHLDSPVFIWLIAALFSLSWWAPLVQAIIRAEHHYRLLGIYKIGSPFLNLGSTVLLTGLFSWGLPGAVLARVLSGFVMLVLLMKLIRYSHRGDRQPYGEERSTLLRMLFPMAVFVVISTLGTNFDRLFVRNFMMHESGGYAAMLTLGQMPRLMITPLIFVLFPIAAAQHASGIELNRTLSRSILLGLFVTGGCGLLFAFTATPLLGYWRAEFAPYGRYVWIYSLFAGLQALIAIFAQIEMARHEYRFLWLYAIPILLMCSGLYAVENYSKLTLTLPIILWTLVGSHLAVFTALTGYLFLRRQRA